MKCVAMLKLIWIVSSGEIIITCRCRPFSLFIKTQHVPCLEETGTALRLSIAGHILGH